MDKQRIGALLKDLRTKKKKTQLEVVEDLYTNYKIKLSDKTVAKWEKGHFPDMDTLCYLADYYDVKVSDILNGEIYVSQNFEEKYFIVNNEWIGKYPSDKVYQIRVEQERIIKARVKELIAELIEKKSLTAMQNDELNFILTNFYSVSDYAIQLNDKLENADSEQIKLLRIEIYRKILSLYDSSFDEIYWEIKKLFNYNNRASFRKDICGYEANIPMMESLINNLEDWEKDLLLAQVQTQNITDFYDKLTYLKLYGKDYDEERITKEGIKLLINNGARLNTALLGYTEHKIFRFSLLERMKDLQSKLTDRILIAGFNDDNSTVDYYWVNNCLKNRLVDLYYILNCSRREKLSLDEIYNMYVSNENIPDEILLDRIGLDLKEGMIEKEQLLRAEQICTYEINGWNRCKKRELQRVADIDELCELENKWNQGEQFGVREYDEWVGEKEDTLTEGDILKRLSKMTYSEYINNRDKNLTDDLIKNIDFLSLEEIRKRYFPVEAR